MGILNTREGFEKCGVEYSRMEAQGNQIGLVCKGEVGRKDNSSDEARAYLRGFGGGDLTLFESQPCRAINRDPIIQLKSLPILQIIPLQLWHNSAQRTISYLSID